SASTSSVLSSSSRTTCGAFPSAFNSSIRSCHAVDSASNFVSSSIRSPLHDSSRQPLKLGNRPRCRLVVGQKLLDHLRLRDLRVLGDLENLVAQPPDLFLVDSMTAEARVDHVQHQPVMAHRPAETLLYLSEKRLEYLHTVQGQILGSQRGDNFPRADHHAPLEASLARVRVIDHQLIAQLASLRGQFLEYERLPFK